MPRYTGPWEPDDPDANFKEEVAAYSRLDPLATLTVLAQRVDIPVGALVRYVLATWTSEGHELLLHTGPRMMRRLEAVVEEAEAAGTDEARLAAYAQLSQMIRWLALPLEQDTTAPPPS